MAMANGALADHPAGGHNESGEERRGAVADTVMGIVLDRLLDGDSHPGMREGASTGAGPQRLRWRRHEMEKYLLHPDSPVRVVAAMDGSEATGPRMEDRLRYWRDEFPPTVIREPLGEHEFLSATKARTRLFPPLLAAAGVHGFPDNRYHEIAQAMRREEIHPEVTEKLDAICRAFGVEP